MATGIRMHWLYFDANSPRCLEDAGYGYDSTCGYNEAVGFRAGTLQPFRPPSVKTLLELPLAIMDSALFSSRRMNLDRRQAYQLCVPIVAAARRFGGALVLNWHERSLAPERLWGDFYVKLLRLIAEDARVWFTTAGRAVEWFRWRRTIRFIRTTEGFTLCAAASPGPAAILRIHHPGGLTGQCLSRAYHGGSSLHVAMPSDLPAGVGCAGRIH
jgi:hypothetical protein